MDGDCSTLGVGSLNSKDLLNYMIIGVLVEICDCFYIEEESFPLDPCNDIIGEFKFGHASL